MPCLVGFATGLVVALGTVSMATSPSELFTHPAPLFLISQLLFLLLGVITAFGLDLRKATYFALINLCWGAGVTIGMIGREHFIPLPDPILVDLSSFVCLLTLVGFFAFSGIWVNTLGRTASMSRESAVEDVARKAGLTKRETEVGVPSPRGTKPAHCAARAVHLGGHGPHPREAHLRETRHPLQTGAYRLLQAEPPSLAKGMLPIKAPSFR